MSSRARRALRLRPSIGSSGLRLLCDPRSTGHSGPRAFPIPEAFKLPSQPLLGRHVPIPGPRVESRSSRLELPPRCGDMSEQARHGHRDDGERILQILDDLTTLASASLLARLLELLQARRSVGLPLVDGVPRVVHLGAQFQYLVVHILQILRVRPWVADHWAVSSSTPPAPTGLVLPPEYGRGDSPAARLPPSNDSASGHNRPC